MNYKDIIKSRDLRIKILQFLSFLPDKEMLRIQYYIKTGKKLNLSNPKRYTEKLQWYKLNYRTPEMISCVDKFEVRQYIKSIGYSRLLNDNYGVYDSFGEIDFEILPDSFVLKDTLGGGGNSVIIVKEKKKVDIEEIEKQCNKWTSVKIKRDGGREWPYYSGKKHRIICDELLSCSNGDLPDYKFFCFDGICECFYVRVEYANSHEDGKLAFFDVKKNNIHVSLDYCKEAISEITLPDNIDEMVCCAESIAKGFPHCRVDLYNIDGRIVFGEITFYSASGYFKFNPDSFDFKLGEKFKIRL